MLESYYMPGGKLFAFQNSLPPDARVAYPLSPQVTRRRYNRVLTSRRELIKSLCRTASIFSLSQVFEGLAAPLPVQFVNVAREAGLNSKTIFGDERRNKYLLETTGCGAAFFDFDNDGWLDIFLVNGTRFEAHYTAGNAPTSRLYKNNRDGTFTDITAKSGLVRTGWGQGCLYRRLRQRWVGRSVRNLLGRLRAVSQQWQWHIHGRGT